MPTTDIEIFGRSTGCGACLATDRGIARHGLDRLADSLDKLYVDQDEDAATEAREVAAELGLESQAPLVVVYRDDTRVDAWTGYRPDKLKALAAELTAARAAVEFVEAPEANEEAAA